MSSGFPSPTATPLFPYALPSAPFPSTRFLCETWWTCTSTRRGHTWRQRSDSLFTTEQPFSVMFPSMRHDIDLQVNGEPGWKGAVPDWQEIPCRVGRVEVCLAVGGTLPVRPFSLLVLLPRWDPPDPLPYPYLGVQFLVEYLARVQLDCSTGIPRSCGGQLIIP